MTRSFTASILNPNSQNHIYVYILGICDSNGSRSRETIKIAIDARFSFVSWWNSNKSLNQSGGNANRINVNADISESIRHSETILLFFKYFICAILLNIYHRKKISLALLSFAFSLPVKIKWKLQCFMRSDMNFISNFYQNRQRLTWTGCECIWIWTQVLRDIF